MNAARKLEALLSQPKTRAAFCRAYVQQHPALAVTLTATPGVANERTAATGRDHHRTWSLIAKSAIVFAPPPDNDLFPRPAEWCGTAAELRELLLSPASALTPEEKASIPSSVWLGMDLTALHNQFGGGIVVSRRTNACRRWLLRKG